LSHDHSNTKHIKTAFILNVVFTLIEFGGGYYTNSIAILSDAFHDLGDSFSLGIAWYFQKLASKKSDDAFTFGYKRFSILGALINGLILVVGSLFIIYHAALRFQAPQEVHSIGMFILAIIGVVANSLAAYSLSKGQSLNEKVVRLHLLEDVLGWVAVLIGSAIIYFTSWLFIDSLLSVGIGLFILYNAIKSVVKSIKIVLQASPIDESKEELIKRILARFSEIDNIHDFHMWSLDGDTNVVSIHIQFIGTTTPDNIFKVKTSLRELLRKKNFQHITIETDLISEKDGNISL
jgi:cobalt-zinc-cadmium efflux system protein